MEISEIRSRIEPIDDELLKLFLERMDLIEEVTNYKRENHMPINDFAREREILTRITKDAGDREMYVHHFFTNLFQLSKARQREMISSPSNLRSIIEQALENGGDIFPKSGTVACQGMEGSNSQVAAEKMIPRGNVTHVKSFDAVFEAVDSGLCKYGVLPIENSSNGSVRGVYELLQSHQCYIIGSTKLFIRHELLAKPGTKMEDIRAIYSHEQAIGQCSRFLNKLGDQVTVIPCSNTAVAAKKVAESDDPHIAAIASHGCTEIYGLKTVCKTIQNSDNNYTRFICISKEPRIFAGANRISLVINCNNKPGALYDILSKLAIMDINMNKLESCPVIGSDFEFSFFLDIDASVKEPGLISLLEELERICAQFAFLGNYTEV